MDITPALSPNINFINGYSAEGFRINGQMISDHIILSPTKFEVWNIEQDIFTLNNYDYFINNFAQFETYAPIVLIGTGNSSRTPPSELVKMFKTNNIALEIMSTPAACRTYNVLIAERSAIYALLVKVK